MAGNAFRLIAAPFTPFREDGSLNLERVPQQADWLADSGVDGVFVAGTTGESSSLTLDERMALAACWCDVARSRDLETIIQVGDNCQANACRLADHAQSVGADAVASYAPCYFKPGTTDDLTGFLAPVARAAGELAFYYYEIPGMTGVRLPMRAFLEQAKPRIPNLVGLKYSHDDLVQLQECVQLQQGEFELLFGRDEALLAGWSLGVSGAVGCTYNFVAPLYRRMLQAARQGDWPTARSLQTRSVQLVRTLESFGFLPAAKYTMGCLGIDCGPVRSPLRTLDRAARDSLRHRLQELELGSLAANAARGEVRLAAEAARQAEAP